MNQMRPRSGWWLVIKDGMGAQLMGLNDQTLERLPWDKQCHRSQTFQCGPLSFELHEVSIPKFKGWHLQLIDALNKVVRRKPPPD